MAIEADIFWPDGEREHNEYLRDLDRKNAFSIDCGFVRQGNRTFHELVESKNGRYM